MNFFIKLINIIQIIFYIFPLIIFYYIKYLKIYILNLFLQLISDFRTVTPFINVRTENIYLIKLIKSRNMKHKYNYINIY